MSWLMHTNQEPVADVVDNILYKLEPGEPFEMPDFHARAFLDHMRDYGVVQVPETKDRTGIHLDLDAAVEAADRARDEAEKRVVDSYIRDQTETRLSRNFPALPPTGRLAKIIERRGIKLADYNLHPGGFKPSEAAQRQQLQVERLESELSASQRINERLEARLSALEEKAEPKAQPKATGKKK